MRYFYFDVEGIEGKVRHITFQIMSECWVTFPDVEFHDGPERSLYLEWLAEGNKPELWQPQDGND